MDEFDKEFDNAPDAAFDDEFDKAEPAQSVSLMDKISQGASSFVNAPSPLGPSLKDTAQTVEDFSVGAAQGATLGAADEIGGGFSALLEKGAGKLGFGPAAVDEQLQDQGFEVPGTSLADTYRDYQKGSEQAFKESNDRSPIVNTLGNIGGSVATGIAVGGALGLGAQGKNAKTIYDVYKDSGKMKAGLELLKRGGTSYAKMAPAIAAESALVSEGTLDDSQGREKLGEDVLGGLAFGLPAVVGMEGATDFVAPAAKAGLNKLDDKFGQLVDANPFMRKYGIGVKHGEMGTKPTSEAGLNALEGQQIGRTTSMLDNFYAADKTLGKAVGKSIDDATASGARLDIQKPVTKALKALDFSYNTFQDMAENARGRTIFEKIQNSMNGDVTPSEAKGLLDDVDAFIGKFNASRNRTTAEEATLSTLQKVRKELSDQMKRDIPAYGLAAERFTDFRKNIPETILAKDRPVDVSGIFMGNMKNADKQLYDSMNALQMDATSQGSGASAARKAYGNLMNGMKQFEANELARGTKSPLVQNSDEFGKQLRQYSDEAGFLKDVQTVKSPFVTQSNVISQVGQLGHSGALSTSLLVGRAKKPIQEISRRAYNMPAEKLNTLADQMMTSPGLKVLGKALKEGLENGDQAKKNAAIFSILQNPEARLFVEQDEEQN